jgi:Zn-dependent membrane protease YugP
MFYFDPLWFVFAIPGLLVLLWAQMKVRSAYSKYSQVRNGHNIPGAKVARMLLDSQGLYDIAVEATPGELTDHYDPGKRVLRLSQGVYGTASVAAMGIVAHEVGHAVQDKVGYAPMRLRSGLVPVANLGSILGYILFFLGFIIQFSGLVWLGVIFFSAAVLFSLVTLPVEYNASNRALALLQTNGLVTTTESDGVRAVLGAAALTYVAAMLQAVGNLLYYVMIATGMSRDD